MSVKYFCDVCGDEMPASDLSRIKQRLDRVEIDIEVIHKLDKTWNSGHVCHPCIRRVILEGAAVTS